MSQEIAGRRGDQLPTNFEPHTAKEKVSVFDAAIGHAKRLKDWPALEAAVDLKIEELSGFVRWWSDTVSVRHRPPGGKPVITERLLQSIPADKAEELTGINPMQVSRWRKELAKPDLYRAKLYGAAYMKAWGSKNVDSQLVQQSLSNEHYTPPIYIEAARRVLGSIDLDPASCAEANQTVRAGQYFTATDDGMKQSWSGRVWLNPPYGGMTGAFVQKLINEYSVGSIDAAIILVNAHCTDTKWFQPLWDGVLCFTDHRIDFSGDEGRSGSTHGSVFVYFGVSGNIFKSEFSKFGVVVAKA